jgi:MFS superfamily sulfate permease-like transporter
MEGYARLNMAILAIIVVVIIALGLLTLIGGIKGLIIGLLIILGFFIYVRISEYVRRQKSIGEDKKMEIMTEKINERQRILEESGKIEQARLQGIQKFMNANTEGNEQIIKIRNEYREKANELDQQISNFAPSAYDAGPDSESFEKLITLIDNKILFREEINAYINQMKIK